MFFSSQILSQSDIGNNFSIEFSPVYEIEKSNIELNQYQEINLEMLKFYVGHISFYYEDKLQWIDSTYHLVNFEDLSQKTISLSIPNSLEFDQVSVNIGVDSITNTSGAFEGDLDPINGMYWAWNTGYINLKIEGNIVDKNKDEIGFKFHLGGYQAPHESVQNISFPITDSEVLSVKIDLPKFLNDIELTEDIVVMSPSKKAALFSYYFSQCLISE